MFDALPLLIGLLFAAEPKPLPEKLEGRVVDVFPGDRVLLSFGAAQGARPGMAILLRNETQKKLINLYELAEVSSNHSIARRLDGITPSRMARSGDSALWYPSIAERQATALHLRPASPPAELTRARLWFFTGAVIENRPLLHLPPQPAEVEAARRAMQWEESMGGSLGAKLRSRLVESLPKAWSFEHVSVGLESVSFFAFVSEGTERFEWMVHYSRLSKSSDFIVVSAARGGFQKRLAEISRASRPDDSDLALSMMFLPNGRQWSRYGPIATNRERYFEAKTTELHEHLQKILGP